MDDMTSGTVLVVEDNELNLKLVRDLIKLIDYKALEADSAEKGIELARLHKPDLILMDIELPGMDGLTATRSIRRDPQLKDIPVLALTAYAMDEDRQKALEAGCNGYIAKPIHIKSFQKTICYHLEKTRSSALSNPTGLLKHNKLPSGQRILIVDDDALNLKLLAAQLSSKGYCVMTAEDGETALEKVKTGHPDLILLDIMMPGMDGYEVTARLKSDPGTMDIPVILVTALTGEDEKKKGLETGADEFINKPINYPELEARVFSLLRLKEYQEQLGTRMASEKLMIKGIPEVDHRIKDHSLPTVLVVEDDPTSAKLMIRYLSDMPCTIETARDGEEALGRLALKKIDIILLDVLLPNKDGFEVCRLIKDNEETFPIQVVMITNLTDTRNKLRGIEAGTDDFLVKPVNKDEFRARIKSLFKKKAYLDRLRTRIDTALSAAITDKLTGIYNYGYFKHFLDLEFKRSIRYKHNLVLMMIDVDDFKAINDQYGHQCGDLFLVLIARILKENVREIDLVARYGGEEFAISLPYADLAAVESIAKRLLTSVAHHAEVPSAPGARLSVSIGISILTDVITSPDDLVKTADAALYTAKRRGKNQYYVYTESERRSQEK